MNFLSFIVILSLDISSTARILYKCCPDDQALNENGDCVNGVSSKDMSNISIIISGIESIYIDFSDANRPKCEYWDSMILDWNATNRFSIAKNASLVLHSPTVENDTFHHIFIPGEFCTDMIANTRKRVVKLCPCDRLICLRKCCPAGHVYNFSSGPRCIKSNESNWHPTLITNSNLTNLKYDTLDGRTPKCEGFHNFASTAFIPPYLLNGFWWEYPTGKAFQGRQLCKDQVHGGKFEISIICEEVSAWDSVLKPLWHVPAALLLAVTLVILGLCPELRAGTHGRALFCHASSLLVVNVVLAFNAKHTCFGIRHETYVLVRKSADVIVHYAAWAAAFWLNSICINIGLGFRTNTTIRSAEDERRKFIWFSLYSWLTPLAITITVVVLRMLPHNKVPFLYKPTMIETRSGHYELEGLLKLTSFAYYFAPMSCLLIINLIMFAFTSKKVFALRRASRILTKSSNSKSGNGDKKRTKKISVTDTPNLENQSINLVENTKSMLLYVRLLWTMGVLEMVVEIAMWATHHYFWYEATMDVVDLLRAICIFSLTCCKRRVLRQLRDRFKDCAILRKLHLVRSEEYEMGSAGTSSTSTRAKRYSASNSSS